jgi:hypothetical protein
MIKAIWNVRPGTYEFYATPADLASPLAPDLVLHEILTGSKSSPVE